MNPKLLFQLAAFAVASCISSAAYAVTCPNPAPAPADGLLVYTVNSGASSCFGTGNGAINQPPDTPAILAGYTWLDKSGSSDAFDILDGALTIAGAGPGTWAINAPGYINFVLLFQQNSSQGPNPAVPQWAAFALNALSGDWRIQVWNQNLVQSDVTLSHAVLFGQLNDCPTCAPGETPVPGAAWLMGSVLAGVGGMHIARRRKKARAI